MELVETVVPAGKPRRLLRSAAGCRAIGRNKLLDKETANNECNVKVDYTLDTVGLLCPAPIIKTAEKIGDLEAGQVLEVLSDDPGVEVDMPAWCSGTGHECLMIKRAGREYRVLIRKGAGRV